MSRRGIGEEVGIGWGEGEEKWRRVQRRGIGEEGGEVGTGGRGKMGKG